MPIFRKPGSRCRPFVAMALLCCGVGCGTANDPKGVVAVTVTTSVLPNGLAGSAYSQQLTATGGAGSIIWRVAAGVLPNGLGLSAAGVLSGVPTAGGISTFTVEASSAGQVGVRQLSVTVDVTPVTVTTRALPNAFANNAYTVQLTASGGNGTFTWNLAGPPPVGLTLSPSGLLSGTPATEGTNSVSVQASSAGQIGVKQLSLLVAAASCAPQSAQPPDPAPATAWVWTHLGLPTGLGSDSAIKSFRIDPEDANTWYAGGFSGTFVSHNSGQTWAHPLGGFVDPSFVEFAPGNSCTVYVMDNDPGGPGRLRRSVDRGVTWSTLLQVPGDVIITIHIARRTPGLILVGTGSRVYRSTDFGSTWSFRNLVPGFSGQLIPWDIEEDINGVLYLGTEIATHPQPYRPPFFRSTDQGDTWESSTPPFQAAAVAPWHVYKIVAHPTEPIVYAMTEVAGLYVTTDAGNSWQLTANWPYSGIFFDLALDPLIPTRLFGTSSSALWASVDGAANFHYAGLDGLFQFSHVFLSQSGRVLYVFDSKSGLHRAVVPAIP